MTDKIDVSLEILDKGEKVTFNIVFPDTGEIRQKTMTREWVMERVFMSELKTWKGYDQADLRLTLDTDSKARKWEVKDTEQLSFEGWLKENFEGLYTAIGDVHNDRILISSDDLKDMLKKAYEYNPRVYNYEAGQ